MSLKLRSSMSPRPTEEKDLIHFTQQNCILKPPNLHRMSCCIHISSDVVNLVRKLV